jgi:ABC-2 type transport system permease protein
VLAGVFVMAFTFFHSLTFWLGNASGLAEQAANAMLTFAMYPNDIFQGAIRFMMYTILPAAFVGVVPVQAISKVDLQSLAFMALAAIVITLVSCSVFYAGLRKYESGSAINVNV